MDDSRLLAEYVATGSASAFSQLATRYASLVYGAAFRRVHDHHAAEEVTQAVFVLLARKAAAFRGEFSLSSWLLKATRYAAMDAMKLKRRREQYESRAAAMQAQIAPICDAVADAETDELLGLLDDGLLRLGDTDRQAVMLRFYEQKSFDDVGRRLGVDADAARKRVSRTVERLRAYFLKRGVVSTTSAIVALLATELRVPHPASLPAQIVTRVAGAFPDRLADSVQSHMTRAAIGRWTVGVAAAVCLCGLSVASLRSTLQQWATSPAASHAIEDAH